MPRRGRPERPINADGGSLPQLASELRRLRGNLTYRDLAAKTDLSVTTLRDAAAGEHLPTWRVTRAFAAACGGEGTISTVRKLWEEACIAAGRPVPSDSSPVEEPPAPHLHAISDGEQFVEEMKRLRSWAGNPSLAELNKRSGGYRLPPSTVSEVLRGKRKFPRLDLVQAYVRACGLNDDQAAVWEQTWTVLAAREMHEQLSRVGDPQAVMERRYRLGWPTRILEWLSGVPAEISARTPAGRAECGGLAGTILLTSAASALSAAWAVHVVLTPKWPAAIVVGMALGVAVMSLDRLMVASVHRHNGRRNLFVISQHVILSMLLAFLIATPISMRIFAPEINAQADTAQYVTQISTLSRISGEFGPQIQALQNQLIDSQTQATKARNRAKCQLSGGSGCQAGQGPAYAAALKSYESAEVEVANLQGQVNNLRSQQATAQKNAITVSNQQGLLSNLAALNQITENNKTIAVIRWLLFGLFTLLGCAPAIVKTLKVLRPDKQATTPEIFVLNVPAERETLIAWQRGAALAHRPQA